MAESNVCSSCGASLPSGAAFCGGCGARVEAAGKSEVPAEANPLKKLLYVIWASIGIGALSSLIGVFDVREYYLAGQFLFIVLSLPSIAFSVWLAFGIAKRKNWARVTFIIYSLLYAFLFSLVMLGGEGGNAFVSILNMAEVALTVYCVVMLFTKKVSGLFLKSGNGKKLAWTFWGVFFGYLVFSVVCSVIHASSDEYPRDCAMAAAKGSNEAYESLVEYCVANMEVTGDEAEIRQAAEEAAAAIIAEVCPDEQESQPTRPAKKSGKSDSACKDALFSKEVLEKVFAGVLGALGTAYAWFKEKLGALFGKASNQ